MFDWVFGSALLAKANCHFLFNPSHKWDGNELKK